MRLAVLALLAAYPAAAHVVSMSTGDATLKGSRLDYELRMPVYEIAQTPNPEHALFANIHFYGGGQEAQLLKHECREEAANLVCSAVYLFAHDVQEFRVRCTFPSITVPNHVHLLRAVRGDRNDSEAFDASFTEADIRFRPATPLEKFMHDAGAGFWRAASALAQILFLIALLLAARSWRDLAMLFGMFAVGQIAAALFGRTITLSLSPRFIEAAAALTIAYFAVEVLLLPNAGGRWIVAGVLGLFHGVYFSMLLTGGEYRPVPYLAGAILAELAILATLWMLAWFVRPRFQIPFQRLSASLLLVIGIGWFLIRLKN
jgi:HupE/UreJ protein